MRFAPIAAVTSDASGGVRPFGDAADYFMTSEVNMKKLLAKFAKDESGAALVEYSLLIGLITVGVVAMVIAVGAWVTGEWTQLRDAVAPVGP